MHVSGFPLNPPVLTPEQFRCCSLSPGRVEKAPLLVLHPPQQLRICLLYLISMTLCIVLSGAPILLVYSYPHRLSIVLLSLPRLALP
jgi:hypothetical protein